MAGDQQKKPLADPNAQPESLEDQLDALELKVDRIKVLYDQYFMGIEKIEPLVPRKEVNRTIINLAKIQIRNTGLRFRYRTIVQRFNVHITYWNRILRQIELGTYKRDVIRASRAMAAKGAELPEEIAAALSPRERARLRAAAEEADQPVAAERRGDDKDLPPTPVLEMEADEPPAPVAAKRHDDEDLPTPRQVLEMEADEPPAPAVLEMEADEPPPSPPPRPAAPTPRPPTPMGTAPVRRPTPTAGAPVARITPVARPATPPAGAARPPTPMGTAPVGAPARSGAVAGGMTREQIDVLYRRLIHAKKLCGEPTGGLSAESLAATIEKTAPKVMQEKGCREVEFTVIIKNDKAVLKAIPKK